jgi:hypothetical protein
VQKNSIVHALDWDFLSSVPSLKAINGMSVQVFLVTSETKKMSTGSKKGIARISPAMIVVSNK